MAGGRRGAHPRIDVLVKRFNTTPHEAQQGLMRAFGLDQAAAHRFVQGLPAVAKHGADPRAAERYASALRSIGADVELIDTVSGAALPSTASSLPAPSSSLAPAFNESMRVARATDEAVARFRAEEEHAASGRPWGQDHNPVIPQAPRLPGDLGRMANARITVSNPPSTQDVPLLTSEGPIHFDAAHPPPRTSLGTDARPAAQRTRAGVGHSGAPAPERAGAAPPLVLSLPPQRERSLRWPLLAAAVALVAASTYAAIELDVFASEADQLLDAWAARGITGGEHAILPDWLDRPERSIDGIGQAELRKLVGGLTRAGAGRIWAVRIELGDGDTELGAALVVELPLETDARRTVFWQLRRIPGQRPSQQQDHGQRFHEVTFTQSKAP